MPDTFRRETICAAAGVARDPAYGAVAPPVYLAANYAWPGPDEKPEYDYARSGNPTREALERALCDLEGAEKGVVTSSGMAAIDLTLNLVGPGETVLAPHDCYGGVYRLLMGRAAKGAFKLEFVDQTDARALERAFAGRPKLVLIETPSNPLLRIVDIRKIVARANTCGAVVVADNTFLSPALQRPLELGCDIVVHSTTKFLNGHSDVVGGAALARDRAVGEELAWWANATGVTGAPFDSYLTLRGVRTLFPRIERQQATAAALVDALGEDGLATNIHYPGLASHPGHAIARAQQDGFGAMFSVEFAESVDPRALLRSLRIFTVAESLGGFESLVCAPASMTHASMSAEARARAGISDRLIRFSVGLEHADDLIADLRGALERAIVRQPLRAAAE